MSAYRVLFLLCALLTLPVAAQDRGLLKKVRLSSGQEMTLYSRSYALVIGVQSYTHWDRLINPLRDAHEVGEALKQQGFSVTYLDDPDAEALKAGLNAFAYGPGGRDEDARVVVFFAGHGHTEETASGQRGFILPRDVPQPDTDRVGFMSKAVSMDFIKELATGMLAKHVLFIFDSCFSGTLLRGNAHPEPITEKTTKKVRQFITSGSANEQVPDESVFKASLLNALDGDADKTQDGYVTGEELGWYLKGRVMEYTKGAQTPQYGKIQDPNLDQGDMVFVLEEPSGVSPAPEPITPPPPAAVSYGHLQVNVNAPTSQVYVDDRYRGTASPRTPLNLSDVGLGKVRVRVTAEEYEEATQQHTLTANEWTQAVFELVPVKVPPPSESGPPSSRSDPHLPPTSRHVGQMRTFSLPGGAEMTFMWIEPGTFQMGSPPPEEGRDSEEGPQHTVTIRQGFYLGKYEITQAQWTRVMGRNPSKYRGTNRPVEQISWEDAQAFIHKLNQAAGAAVYRLPTEAEWEYACRAGTTTRWSLGDDESPLGEYAWYEGNNSPHGTKEIGRKKPNLWGLYDMHGNVWEWCQDRKGSYPSGSQIDPMGSTTGSNRIIRGGGFFSPARNARSAARGDSSPDYRSGAMGARLLRTP